VAIALRYFLDLSPVFPLFPFGGNGCGWVEKNDGNNEVDESMTKETKRKRCSHEGCTNFAKKGGVCVTHGAMVKQCSREGCTNKAVKGGVCITHGAEVTCKCCTHEGCTNKARKGGVCFTLVVHCPPLLDQSKI
jgi:hypothetical protein